MALSSLSATVLSIQTMTSMTGPINQQTGLPGAPVVSYVVQFQGPEAIFTWRNVAEADAQAWGAKIGATVQIAGPALPS